MMRHLGPPGAALKVHFVATGGAVVGAVYADALEYGSEGIAFYLGTRQVALLSQDRLHIEQRTVERGVLDEVRPFRYEEIAACGSV